MAPMSLMTYQEVRPWARSIKNKVLNREMPPWHIDKNIGIQIDAPEELLAGPEEDELLLAGADETGAAPLEATLHVAGEHGPEGL